jgi:hypothetical protein
MTSLNEIDRPSRETDFRIRESNTRSVWLLIFLVATVAKFTRGLTLAGRFWLTLLLAPLTIASVIALMADLDTPSSGLIRVDQRAMQRLKADISGPP